jgi:exopolyphosphatase/guanosine-5'-triphosphate,3'-diphosphate pyrophosphatase
VSHHIAGSTGTNLVVDIGGGSTEMIIGQGYEPKRLESLSVGCVGLSERYFAGGRITGKRFRNARLAVSLEFRPILSSFRRTGWDRAVGSSGTIKTAGAVIAELGLDAEGITLPALERLIDRMISARRVDALRLPEVNCDRAPVFPGGVAILAEALANLGIDRLAVSDGALREGLLYDMIGRLQHEDARERSIRAMQARFHVDEEQASRVDNTAAQLLSSVVGEWSLDDESCSRLLHWAARLHEVGLDIAHAKYHQHGAYLVANADLPGFASFEQQRLAILIGHHRRKLDELRLELISEDWRERLFHLIVVLRLAVLLNRARSPIELPTYELIGQKRRLILRLPKTWFTANPLTHADLLQEKAFLETRGFELVFESKRKLKA